MASCQSTGANGTKTSFPNTTPTGGDVCSFAENATILISTPLTVIAVDVLSNDLAGIALCSIDNEFSPSTDGNSASADCEDPTDIRYPADSRSWALGVCTNVIGPNANSSDPGALAQDQAVCWRRRTCPHRFAIFERQSGKRRDGAGNSHD
jgi:hypothetical protein